MKFPLDNEKEFVFLHFFKTLLECNVIKYLPLSQVWNSYFSLAVLFINQPSLQLENATPPKRKKILDK